LAAATPPNPGAERNNVTVLVSFFGRVTPVRLDFLQIEKV
jgi:transcription antitermination factor NusG